VNRRWTLSFLIKSAPQLSTWHSATHQDFTAFHQAIRHSASDQLVTLRIFGTWHLDQVARSLHPYFWKPKGHKRAWNWRHYSGGYSDLPATTGDHWPIISLLRLPAKLASQTVPTQRLVSRVLLLSGSLRCIQPISWLSMALRQWPRSLCG
jgi:hypothetical protein